VSSSAVFVKEQDQGASALPAALGSRNPFAWLTIFGPGAVIASLTIGAGELIFSSRAGALFGYRLLWFFALVLVLKWVLVFATARHMVLTGAHPFQRWMDLPGPRGWLPTVFLLLALVCFPIWISFHAGTLGTLLGWLTGTQQLLHGGAHLLWGMAALVVVLGLVAGGGYAALERVQLIIVALMLLSVLASLLLLKPDWLELLKGLVVPRLPEYPSWIASQPELAQRPVWVECITYVGVLGGSGYDYLAYVSYIRAKHWGQAGQSIAAAAMLQDVARDPQHINRRWLRALWIDSLLSFLAVLVFAGVFVVCGAKLLSPQHQVPGGVNLLNLQAQFISPLYPWMKPLYFLGAFLAIFGTLYGTIEVAPPILHEFAEALAPGSREKNGRRLRQWAVAWAGLGGFVIVLWNLTTYLTRGAENSTTLVGLLTPANLFTGVLACGLICLLSLWTDSKCLPPPLRMSWPLQWLTAVAGLIFLALGFKGYWDQSGWPAFIIFALTLAAGWLLAWALRAARN
jgi:hypothetical protein